jgi:hypothetical protein
MPLRRSQKPKKAAHGEEPAPAAQGSGGNLRTVLVTGFFVLAAAIVPAAINSCTTDRDIASQKEATDDKVQRELDASIRLVDHELQSHWDGLDAMVYTGRIPDLLRVLNGPQRFSPAGSGLRSGAR